MASLVRTFDWASTRLGPVSDWPDRLRAVIELVLSSPIVASLAVLEDRLLIYNDAAARLYGTRHPDALGRPLGVTFPDSYPSVAGIYDRVFAGETVTVCAQPLAVGTGAGGEVFDAYLMPVRHADGSVIGAHMIGFEIGAKSRDDAMLRQSEERFRAFVTASSDVVYRMSPDWRQMRQLDGQGFLADTASPRETWMDHYIHPDDRSTVQSAIDRAIASKDMFQLEHRIRRVDGTLGWTLSRAVPILDEQDEIKEWLGAASDISARKAAEAALRDNEDRLSLLVAELQHRTRNLLTVVSGIADRSRWSSGSLDEFGERFDRRLAALGRVQGLLSTGPLPSIALDDLLLMELNAHGIDAAADRSITLVGPSIALPADAVQLLALGLHELTTNALKHGALKNEGRLDVSWTVTGEGDARLLTVHWREHGVPMDDGEPRRGFGRELIENDLPYELDADTRLTFGADGIACRIVLPLSAAE